MHGSPAALRKKTLPANGSEANQTVTGRKATHCRVTVCTPGIGRSISRSRRLQTTEAPLHQPILPLSPAIRVLANHPHVSPCKVTWLSGHHSLPGSIQVVSGTFPMEPTSWSLTCSFIYFFSYYRGTNHVLHQRGSLLPIALSEPPPDQWTAPQMVSASTLNLSLTLAPISESIYHRNQNDPFRIQT